jgi:tRNA/tmRNA/rRNA uracil-C5-methylase (TrmA/RlmC/RlmD family)
MSPAVDPGQTEEERAYYSLSRRVYPVFAPFYDAVALPLRKLRHEVTEMVDLGPDARVLDVATGTGSQALAFAAKAREVVGIDLSEAMLRVARRKNRFTHGEGREEPCPTVLAALSRGRRHPPYRSPLERSHRVPGC